MKGFENQWAADFEKMLRTMAPAVIRAMPIRAAVSSCL